MPKSFGGVMNELKNGDLHSGSKNGPVVHSRAQGIAIALSEQRKQGKNVPPNPNKKKKANPKNQLAALANDNDGDE